MPDIPDIRVVDAVVGLKGMNLAGTAKKIGLILASFDAVALDTVGSKLLSHNPSRIKYLVSSQSLGML